ncbi:HEPN domain-containing protein [Microcoleus sp. LEGE 07076]|uniref:HEPN domain-containing protein n=1 Tax=Microcoleus sp. LEGE 07076 TaxID=915322 RepID=UPI001881EAEC|nr:HEPN domain-containing protein [Microcoleus sp. LEGE 07076]MBE9187491.1 HEPN domain-containing protein [Microcoleus sp. LEGE 07076]
MNLEQQRLLDKADRTLQAARVLCDQGFFDSAASRAYYVMFYTVTAFLESEKLSYSRHSAVIAGFGQKFARSGRVPVQFHRYLIDAQKTRLEADYNADIQISQTDAVQTIDRAEEMLNFALANIDSIPPSSP